MSAVKIPTSRLFEEIRRRKEKLVVCEGSSRSTKTYSICQRLIELALLNEGRQQKKTMSILILRQRLTWCRSAVLKDFQAILRDQFKLWKDEDFSAHYMTYRLGHTTFEFRGLDTEHGQKFHGAKYDYAWFNEAVELDFQTVRQIMLRLTGQAFFDYNPNYTERHWIETKIKGRDDCAVLHSTYKDNPFLEESVVKEIERMEPTPENIAQGTADDAQWKIYGLGIRATLRGLIFPAFGIVKEIPKDAATGCYGMDLGFSNDPTALVEMRQKAGCLYFDEQLYERGLTNIENPNYPDQPSIEQRLKALKVPQDIDLWIDSAEPKTIQDLKNCGWNAKGVRKGQIIDGINLMRRFRLCVTERSMNLIDELHRYKWREGRDGEPINVPVGGADHAIDAARYCTIAAVEHTIESSAFGYDRIRVNTLPEHLAAV